MAAAPPEARRIARLRVVRTAYACDWSTGIAQALTDPRTWLFALLLALPQLYRENAWVLFDPTSVHWLGFVGMTGALTCRRVAGLTAARGLAHELQALPPATLEVVGAALEAIDELNAGSPRIWAIVEASKATYVRCVFECARDIADALELQRMNGGPELSDSTRALQLTSQLAAWTGVLNSASAVVTATTPSAAEDASAALCRLNVAASVLLTPTQQPVVAA